MHRALAKQGWLYGKKFNQWGNPFLWIDGPLHIPHSSSQSEHLAGWVSSYYDAFPALPELDGTRYRELLDRLSSDFRELINHLLPPFVFSESDITRYVYGLSTARAQDVRVLEVFAPELDLTTVSQLDFGPGMGVSAVWNTAIGGEGARYTAVEIDDKNYALQRSVFSYLAARSDYRYFDALAAEGMIPDATLDSELNSPAVRIAHVPSWHMGSVNDHSQDLVTATTVLNEVGHAAIGHFVSQANRVLRPGGYVYIRDSGRTKPGRHGIDYESFLASIGYKRVDELKVIHRSNMHGVPRLWKKESHLDLGFDEVMQELVGDQAVVTHGSDYVHSISSAYTK